MGTDIHGVFQRRNGSNEWVDVPSKYDESRHYQLFAVLADVRNGFGFAGIPTGDAVRPIDQPRGLPKDFPCSADQHTTIKEVWDASGQERYYKPGENGYGEVWMGDHSHSWLTGAEMLAWVEKAPVVEKVGVVDWPVWEKWDRKTEPSDYCGDVGGRDVVVVSRIEAEAGKRGSHVRVRWHSSLRKDLAYFFDEVARLMAEYGEIRYVFGFDS